MKNYIQEMGNWGAECRLYGWSVGLVWIIRERLPTL